MRTYEEIKETIGTFKSSDKVRESYIKTTNQRLTVACYEEAFKAIQNKDRKACFNYEYSLTKTDDTKLTEARVYAMTDSKSLFQIYSKDAGKEYEVVLSKIEKYHEAFIEALKDISTLSDGKVFKCRCTFDKLPLVIEKAHAVLSVKTEAKKKSEAKKETKK